MIGRISDKSGRLSGGNRATLLLMEQLIIATVFAVAAAICVQIFVSADISVKRSAAQDIAVAKAEAAAEIYKSCRGDQQKMADYLADAVWDGTALVIYYDEDWIESKPKDACYMLQVVPDTTPVKSLINEADVSVSTVDYNNGAAKENNMQKAQLIKLRVASQKAE